jgi:hypothetical protein
MTDLKSANEVLNQLTIKLLDARNRLATAQTGTTEVAFAAHCDDAAARKQLDKFEADAAKASIEIRGLEAAVAEAKKRVEAAVAAENDEAEREKARTALALLSEFEVRGAALDKALDGFVNEYLALTNDIRSLELLGHAPTTFAVIEINMKAAVQTKLMDARLESDYLAPHQRKTFGGLIEYWAANVRGRIEQRLQKKPPKAA